MRAADMFDNHPGTVPLTHESMKAVREALAEDIGWRAIGGHGRMIRSYIVAGYLVRAVLSTVDPWWLPRWFGAQPKWFGMARSVYLESDVIVGPFDTQDEARDAMDARMKVTT